MLPVLPEETGLNVQTCLNLSQQMELREVFIQNGRTLGIICLLVGFTIGFVSCWIYAWRRSQVQDEES